MIFQTEIEIWGMIVWLIAVVAIFSAIFLILTFKKYLERKARVAFYFSLYYLGMLISSVCHFFGYLDIYNHSGQRTEYYSILNAIALVAIMFNTLMLLLFLNELLKKSIIFHRILPILGAILIIVGLLPFNYDITLLEFQPKKIVFALLGIYALIVYTKMAQHFYNFYKLSSENRNQIKSIIVGSLSFNLYIIIMLIYAFTLNPLFLLLCTLILDITLIFYYFGFVKKVQKEQK